MFPYHFSPPPLLLSSARQLPLLVERAVYGGGLRRRGGLRGRLLLLLGLLRGRLDHSWLRLGLLWGHLHVLLLLLLQTPARFLVHPPACLHHVVVIPTSATFPPSQFSLRQM